MVVGIKNEKSRRFCPSFLKIFWCYIFVMRKIVKKWQKMANPVKKVTGSFKSDGQSNPWAPTVCGKIPSFLKFLLS